MSENSDSSEKMTVETGTSRFGLECPHCNKPFSVTIDCPPAPRQRYRFKRRQPEYWGPTDPWLRDIRRFCETHPEVTMETVLTQALEIPKYKHHRGLEHRVGACLRYLGYEKKQRKDVVSFGRYSRVWVNSIGFPPEPPVVMPSASEGAVE